MLGLRPGTCIADTFPLPAVLFENLLGISSLFQSSHPHYGGPIIPVLRMRKQSFSQCPRSSKLGKGCGS